MSLFSNIVESVIKDAHPEYIYHSVIDRGGIGFIKVIRSVVRNGLVPKNNGEVGSVIWFNPHDSEYARNGRLTVRLKMTTENIDKYEITGDGGTFFAHKAIPFESLEVVDCPVLVKGDNVLNFSCFGHGSSIEKFARINDCDSIAEYIAFKSTTAPCTIFYDVWDRYVEKSSSILKKNPEIELEAMLN